MKNLRVNLTALMGSFMVLASFFWTLNTYADNAKDTVIFGNASAIVPANTPGNPYPFDLKVKVPSGIVMTTVDGSTDPLYFRDNARGADIITQAGSNQVLAEIPHENVCLSVWGNKAVLWHRFTETIPGFCTKGELSIEYYDLDTNKIRAQTVSAVLPGHFPVDENGNEILESCGPGDLQYVTPPYGYEFNIDKVHGSVMLHDGV